MNELAPPSKMQPALIGGVILGVLSAVPFVNALNCFCCLWVIAGGVVAAYLYQKESPLPVQYGDGAVLGLLTGLFGAVVEAIISIPFRLLGAELASGSIQEALRELESNPDIPPELVEFIRILMSGGAATGIISLAINLVIFAIFATIGAIIGVAIFSRSKGDATPPPTAEAPTAPPPSAPPPPAPPAAE